MTYRIIFLPSTLKEWKKLDPSIQQQFKKKLILVQENPYISKNKLSDLPTRQNLV
jgi:mRNA interferase RelE/StbE